AFGAELDALRLANIEIFEQREDDILNSRPAHHVTAFIAELAGLSNGIELHERRPAYPLVRRVRLPGVGIGYEIGPAREKAGDLRSASLEGHIGAVVDREWSAAR